MKGVRTETFHYTPEQVRGHVAEALAVLRDEELDPADYPELLTAVYNSLAAKNITVEAVVPGIPNMAIPRGV